MALAEDLFVRPVPTRATLYARHWPEMARKARRWALELFGCPMDGMRDPYPALSPGELTPLRRIGGGLPTPEPRRGHRRPRPLERQVPEVLGHCDDPKLIGAPFFLMSYIPGATINDVLLGGSQPRSTAGTRCASPSRPPLATGSSCA